MHDPRRIRVSVIFAAPDRAIDVSLELPAGATVAAAIERSGIRSTHPDIGIRDDCLGLFGRKVAVDTLLRDGDRVEIYRPLKVDPKEARRKRAADRRRIPPT